MGKETKQNKTKTKNQKQSKQHFGTISRLLTKKKYGFSIPEHFFLGHFTMLVALRS